MKKCFLILVATAFIASACAGHTPKVEMIPDEEDFSAPDEESGMVSDEEDSSAFEDDSEMTPDVQSNTIELHEPFDITVHYPVVGNAPQDRTLEGYAQTLVEDILSMMSDGMDLESMAVREENGEGEDASSRIHFEVEYSIAHQSAETGLDVIFSTSYYTGGAHPGFYYSTIMIDPEGDVIEPLSLFESEEEGLQRLSTECRAQIRAAVDNSESIDDMIVSGTEPVADHFTNIVREDDGSLLVLFSPYAVAPWAVGPLSCRISE